MDLFTDTLQPQDSPEPPPENLPSHTDARHASVTPLPPAANPFESDSVYWRRVGIAILLSLLLNLLALWLPSTLHMPDWKWFQHPKPPPSKQMSQLVLVQRPPPTRHESPTFLETDPSQLAKKRPENAPFYSEHNTVATQTAPSPVKSDEVPKMEGQNTKTYATENVVPTKPATPSPPAETPAPEKPTTPPSPQTPQTPPDAPKTGDLALLRTPKERPFPKTEPPAENTPQNPQTSPRAPPAPNTPESARQVLAQQSKLNGGVDNVGRVRAFNSAESPFASYDKKIIGKIGAYWQLQVHNKFYGENVGEVEVSFRLMSDGRITNLEITHNSANSVLAGWCVDAIQKSAPFDPFPDAIKAIAGDSREGAIRFAY